MATDAKITVDSSPTEILATLTPEQNKVWRETGELPDFETAPAASSPAKTEEKTEAASSPDAKTEVAAKEPAKAAESAPAKTEPQRKPGAEGRIKELLSENKRLAAELEAARKAPAPPAAKTEEVAKPRRADVDEKTGLAKYATDEAFEEAYETYLTAKVNKDVRAQMAREQAAQRQAEIDRINKDRWMNSLKLANERHADFAKVCEIDEKGAFQNAELKGIKDHGIVDAFVLDSEIGGSLLYYFASHPGEVNRIEAMNAFAAARELTRLEDKLSGSPSSTVSKTETVEHEKVSENGSRVSKAPAPAASVGGRATPPRDEEEAALDAGDFRRYMETANKNEFARKKKAS